MQEIFSGVWKEGNRLVTLNMTPGKKVYTEQLVKVKGVEYREWIAYKSKAAAAVTKGLKYFPLKHGDKVLYLGASSGTTVSHFSDIVGGQGVIYAVEISERSLRDLNVVAEIRTNIIPILANARLPDSYNWIEKADIVYQDVATDDQSEILIRNCEKFLKPGGTAMIAIKSRSIDVTKEPKEIYKQELEKLSKHFKVIEKVELDPLEKDHMFIVLRWK